MRYILLGLSCSLTACLETETTTQEQAQSQSDKTQKHDHSNEAQIQVQSNEEKEEKQEDSYAQDTIKTSVDQDKTEVSQELTAEEQEAIASTYFGSAQLIGAEAPPSDLYEGSFSDVEIHGLVSPPTPENSIPESGLADAGEGAKAKTEEGNIRLRKLDASKKARKVRAPSSPATDSLSGGGGGLIGGLGTRSRGLGKSGTATGLGGLGTKGGPTRYNSFVGDSDNTYSPLVQNTEQYTDHGVNEFTKTSEDAHSTFSIDVDTASYTIARKKIMAGTMPRISAIRTEEFINYFSYQYKTPKSDVFNIDMKAFVDPLRSDHTYLRVGVQAKKFTQKTRPPLNLSFLVDVSGSMSYGDKLPLAKKSMKKLVESLRPDDTISITTYAGRTATILRATKGSNKKAIVQAIDQMESGGSTAMSSGIDLAYYQVWKTFDPKKENRVVVLSDGDANVGNVHYTDLLKQIKSYADRGVTLSTIGFGMGNYKDTLMEQLANKGDGNYYYIDTEKEADKVFVDGFNSTMISIARDVKLQVEFDPDVVSSYRLVGYENRDIADKDFRNDSVDAGEVGAGHSVTALYEIKHTGSEGPLATTRLRYEPPGADGTATERVYQLSSAKIQENPSSDLMLAYTAATFAEVLRKSPYVHDVKLSDLHNLAKQKKLSVDLMKTIKKAMDINTATASAE